jgi:rhodanese-related sulfurtransferase
MIRYLSPQQLEVSAVTVIDVREYPEYAAAAIPGSMPVPLSGIETNAGNWPKSADIVLVCRSGCRALAAAQKLERLGFDRVAVLEGGIEAWQRAGLPVQTAQRKPWSLERQVRVVAGSLVVLSAVLGLTVSPWFFAATLFVGAGLTFAGISDLCLMATMLGKLPWNRPEMSGQKESAVCR